MMLADEVKTRGLEVNCERVLRMALLHDWAETRVGDMPKTATGYFGADERRVRRHRPSRISLTESDQRNLNTGNSIRTMKSVPVLKRDSLKPRMLLIC